MTLRLVLVSMVAGLGISLPGWPILERWVASSQQWMNARLAEWDNVQPDEENYVVIHDLLKVEMERARTARIASRVVNHPASPRFAGKPFVGPPYLGVVRTVSIEESARVVRNAVALIPLPEAPHGHAPVREAGPARLTPLAPSFEGSKPVTFEPLVVGDRLQVGLAYELNHQHEGVGILPRVEVRRIATPSARPAALWALVVDRFGFAAIETVRDLGRDMRSVAARELAAREIAARERIVREAAVQFDALGNSENLYFTDAPVASAPEVVAESEADLPDFETMESSANLYFADSLAADSLAMTMKKAEAEPLAAPAAAVVTDAEPAVATIVIPDDPFAPAEPAVIGDGRPARPTDAVKSEAEPDDSARPAVVAVHTVQNGGVRRPEVSRAVRLTRDALLAWANILTEPALVAAGPSTTTNR